MHILIAEERKPHVVALEQPNFPYCCAYCFLLTESLYKPFVTTVHHLKLQICPVQSFYLSNYIK